MNGPLRHLIRVGCAFARSDSDQAGTVFYQTLRSVSDHHVFVLCRDGTFYELVPDDVRKQGLGRACTGARSRGSSQNTA